ncbi:MAG: ATPase, T2SS/T4P/T4SS family, partial [Sphingomonadaceae bacterium]
MSSTFGPEEAQAYLHKLLKVMHHTGGSDLFISADFPPSMKSQGAMKPLSQQKLTGAVTRALALSIMNDKQKREFEAELECNFAISLPEVCRFRVNVFVQQQNVAMVIRTIASEIPNFEKLDLPEVLKEVIMTKRGLFLLVGGTGSGKSTTLAALIDYRNSTSPGHIITVEDPVEYVHPS